MTEAYVVLYVLTLLEMQNTKGVPHGFPEDEDEQLVWLEKVVNMVVDFAWKEPSPSDLRVVRLAKATGKERQTAAIRDMDLNNKGRCTCGG